MIEVDVSALVEVIRRLPPDKVAEVRDYIGYLDSRYGHDADVDDSDEWSDEDLKDFVASSKFHSLNTE
jgi:hypothetical protein